MAKKSFKQLLASAKQRDSYWFEKAKLQYSVELNRFFKKKNISQADFAKEVGTSAAYITKVFRGDTNFTIETMVKLARAVDGELQITIVPSREDDVWNKVAAQSRKTRLQTSKDSKMWANPEQNDVRISPAA